MKKLTPLLFLTFLSVQFNITAQFQLEDLRVEYLKEPIGIDIAKPRFSWKMSAMNDKRGEMQSAYQIIVSDESGNEVWSTGKVRNDNSLGIKYQGNSLEAETKYHWKLTVWDQDDNIESAESFFETGLMDTGIATWEGAQWIGGTEEDLVFYAHALSVFKLSFSVQLDQKSKSDKAAFVIGGNDRRLQNQFQNLMEIELGMNESYISFELDISSLNKSEEGTAKLNIYRVGYSKGDSKDSPIFQVDVPKSLINKENMYSKHQVDLDVVFGLAKIFINGSSDANQLSISNNAGEKVNEFNLNPIGRGNNYISFPMLADIGFQVNPNQKARFSNIKVAHFREPNSLLVSENGSDESTGVFNELSSQSSFTISKDGYDLNGQANGALLLVDPSKNATPMLRTEFIADKEVAKARLYVTARGIYEMYINGNRVSNDYFNPGVTQYYLHHMYQTYDVTDQIKTGDNAIGAWLSEGWWSGNITYQGENWNFFGDRQSLLTKLVLTYSDGTTETIVSNPDNWKIFTEGPILNGSFFQGEVYDATREQSINGWSEVGYDDSNWKNAVVVSADSTTPSDHDYTNYDLIGQIGRNVTIVDTLNAQSVSEVRPGVFVYDMGQNMVGVPNIDLSNTIKGDTITFRYAEVLYPDLDEYGNQVGMIMMENIRAALTTDKWITKGGPDIFEPRFTFHGFRYLEITGIENPIPVEKVKGLVLSSVYDISSNFESSNSLVNRLWENIKWSMRGNFLSIPTDTPARNERMGWSGDLNVFAQMAGFLGDISPFLRRHMMAMRDLQLENGRFPDVAPVTGGFGGTLWGSAGVIVAWESYQQFKDIDMLKEHYDAMKAYVDFLQSKVNENGVLDEGPLGDWLSPENAKNDNTLLWNAYQVRCLEIVSNAAEILGNEEDSKKYAQLMVERKKFFNDKYVDSESGKTIHSGYQGFRFGPPLPEDQQPKPGDLVDTQASYAIPLAFGVFNDDNKGKAIDNLVATVMRENTDDSGVLRPEYSLMTGFIGTASLNHALSENGFHNAAYKLLQQETYPSWLYPVINGATTIWERLNSYTIEDGFGGNNSMNSFNHYAFGAVGSWMYNYVLGIQRLEPGFKKILLTPTPDPTGKMTWAKGYYDSVYGKIESSWEIKNDTFYYDVSVPANTTAELYLPAKSIQETKEAGKLIKKSEGISNISFSNGKLKMNLAPGKYKFEVVQ